jgi:hypothetical protein
MTCMKPHRARRRMAMLAALLATVVALAGLAGVPAAYAGTNGQHVAPCAYPFVANAWAWINGRNQNGQNVTVRNIWVNAGGCTTGPLVSRYWWKGWISVGFTNADNGNDIGVVPCYVPPSQSGNWVDCYDSSYLPLARPT